MALYESKLLGNESGELSLDLEYRSEKDNGYFSTYGETLWKVTPGTGCDKQDPTTGIYYWGWPNSWQLVYADPVGAQEISLTALKDPSRITNKRMFGAWGIPYVKRSGRNSYVSLYDWFAIVCITNETDRDIIAPIVSSRAFGTSYGPIIGAATGSNNYAREINVLSEYYDEDYEILFKVCSQSPFIYNGSTADWEFKGNLIPLNKHNLWINFPALDCGLYEEITSSEGVHGYKLTADVTCKEGKTYYKDSSGTIAVTEDTLFNDLQTGSLGVFYDYMDYHYNYQEGMVWKQNPSMETYSDDLLHELSQYEAAPNSWYVVENYQRFFNYISEIKFSTAYKLNAATSSKNYVIPIAVIGVCGKGFNLKPDNP